MWDLLKFSNNTAIIDEDGNRYSYRWLDEECRKLVEVIKSRCLVINLCTNTVDSFIGYVSFINGKYVPLMLDANLNSDLLVSLIDTYKPDFLWILSVS